MLLECARVLHKTVLVPFLMYGSDTMIWKEKERFRIRVVQIDNLRFLLDIRRMDKDRNICIRELWGLKKVVDGTICEDVI